MYIKPAEGMSVYNPETNSILKPNKIAFVRNSSYWVKRLKENAITEEKPEKKEKIEKEEKTESIKKQSIKFNKKQEEEDDGNII